MSKSIDCSKLLDIDFYGEHGYPHEVWEKLRKEDPVHLVEDWDGPPYWAITQHADITKISKSPEIFENAPRGVMQAGGADPMSAAGTNLLVMDPPMHREYRGLVSRKFTPKSMSRVYADIDDFTREVIQRASTNGEAREIEFVENISARIPIWVIAVMLGVPKDDWEDLYNWTNMSVGAGDAEYQQGRSEEETRMDAINQMFAYFGQITEERRANPQDDLISDLVHAKIDGRSLEMGELLTYYSMLLSAGNETTRNAITGGLVAIVDYPEQFEKLKADPELLDQFVEETLRFVSPVIHMCRTPNVDVEVGGKLIKAGEPMVLFYPSANRDETIFENPNSFNIDRHPNPHLAFGVGEHFCLGVHLARLELRAVFQQLARCIKYIEPLGAPDRLSNSVVGGIKRYNIRYELDFSNAA